MVNKNELVRKVIKAFPVDLVLEACELIYNADYHVSFTDGPIPKTHEVMSPDEIQQCLSALWTCREYAELIKEYRREGEWK